MDKYQKFLASRSPVLENIAQGGSLDGTLEMLCMTAESIDPQMRCSILLYHANDNSVSHAAAPSLPEFYTTAIDGLNAGVGVASCGTAAATGERVVVEDVFSHSYWEVFRDLAAEVGFVACWSQPFFSRTGDVLGTFALYFDEVRKPTKSELKLIEELANIASLATQNKLDRDELLEAKNKAEEYLNISEAIIVELDHAGCVVALNEHGQRLLDYTSNEITGKNWFETSVPKEQQGEILSVYDRIMSGDLEPVAHYENEIVSKNGSIHVVSWNNKLTRDNTGKITGTLSSGQDITQRKQMERQIRLSEKMKAIEHLASGVVHDFNNMLTVALGNVEIVEQRLTGDKSGLRYLENVSKALEGGKALTDSLLSFANYEGSERSILSLKPFCQEIKETLINVAGTDVICEFLLYRNVWQVELNAVEFEKCMINLVRNAGEAYSGEGCVTIKVSNFAVADNKVAFEERLNFPAADYVLVSVQDTGKGMDAKTINNMFDPFYTTKEFGVGAGLGLSLVHGFMRRNNGYIEVTSDKGAGTTIELYFPRSMS